MGYDSRITIMRTPVVASALAIAFLLLAIGVGRRRPPTRRRATSTKGPCQYTETPDEPAARPVPLPPDPRRTPDRGTVDVTLCHQPTAASR